jgi:AraC-like DNA-binding protein
MGMTYSTAQVGTHRQFQYFRDTICEAVIHLGARRLRPGAFGAEIAAHGFGALRFVEVRCDPVIIERDPSHIARENRGSFFVTLQLTGQGRVLQRGREARLRPGEFTVLDSTEPYVLHFDEPVRRLVVEVPRDEIRHRAGAAHDLRGVTFDRERPGTGLAFQVFAALHHESTGLPPEGQDRLAARALDLAVAAMLGVSGLPAERSADPKGRLAAVRGYAASHLGDPDLDPASAARAAGISVRYLHQLFRGEGTTFGAWLREQRLARCHADIADPAQAGRSLSDIAFTSGFNDAAHFSRAFARRFGYPPSALRARSRRTP